jgi:hypothetical protein
MTNGWQRPLWYVLDRDGKTPIPVDGDDPRLGDRQIWRDPKRIVKRTQTNRYLVSTVFLVIDHNYGDRQFPVLWETMVFPKGSLGEEYCQRYESYDDAVRGHGVAVTWANAKEGVTVHWRVGKRRMEARQKRDRWYIREVTNHR